MASRLKPSAKPDPSSVRACLLLPRGLHFNFVKIPFVCNYLSTFIYPGPLRLKQQASKGLKIMYLLCCILPTFLGSTAEHTCTGEQWPSPPRRFKARVRSCYCKDLTLQPHTYSTAFSLDTKHKHQAHTSATLWSNSSGMRHKPQVAKSLSGTSGKEGFPTTKQERRDAFPYHTHSLKKLLILAAIWFLEV